MIDEMEAVETAQNLVDSLGIKVLGVQRVRKISGALRSEYTSERASDFWLVTLKRSTDVVETTGDLSTEELEILRAVAEANDSITVAVEMDGTAEVV